MVVNGEEEKVGGGSCCELEDKIGVGFTFRWAEESGIEWSHVNGYILMGFVLMG